MSVFNTIKKKLMIDFVKMEIPTCHKNHLGGLMVKFNRVIIEVHKMHGQVDN